MIFRWKIGLVFTKLRVSKVGQNFGLATLQVNIFVQRKMSTRNWSESEFIRKRNISLLNSF